MRIVGALVWLVMALVAFGCIALSCFFAFEFGWTRGSTTETRLAFAAIAACLDLTKAGILLVAADKGRAEQRAGWVAFIFLTSMSLWCAAGMTATQLAERVTKQVVAATQQNSAQAALDRLLAQRKAVGEFKETSAETVKAAEDTVATAAKQAADERASGGCGNQCRAREADERAARAALLVAQNNRSATVKAAELDTKIETAQRVVDDPERQKTAVKDADPQAKSMARVFGVSEDSVALVGHAIFAISVEIGSGLLPWLLFGHGRREEEPEIATRLVAEAVPAALPETVQTIRKRFFDECVIPADGRIAGSAMYAAYCRWCALNNHTPMAQHAFGSDPPWPKRKIGTVYYLNCTLVEASKVPALRLAVSNE